MNDVGQAVPGPKDPTRALARSKTSGAARGRTSTILVRDVRG